MDDQRATHLGSGFLSGCSPQAGADGTVQVCKAEFVLGGTFDPVHLGHLAIVDHLRQHFADIPLRLMLCALPPLKAQPQTAYADRLAMLQLALQERHGVLIDTREQQRSAPSYTIDTLRSLSEERPETHFILVMGMDSLGSLPQWHQWQALAEYCHLLVFNRPGNDSGQAKSWLEAAGFQLAADMDDLLASNSGLALRQTMAEHPHASREIRKAISNQLTLDSLLPQSVIDYIQQHHLYESENI